MRYVALLALLLLTLPASAQGTERIVVAEVEAEVLRPLLSPPEVAGLVEPEFAAAAERAQQRPRFEQSWIARGPSYRLTVDAQFPDGNDFLLSLPLEEVRYGDKLLLVLARPRS